MLELGFFHQKIADFNPFHCFCTEEDVRSKVEASGQPEKRQIWKFSFFFHTQADISKSTSIWVMKLGKQRVCIMYYRMNECKWPWPKVKVTVLTQLGRKPWVIDQDYCIALGWSISQSFGEVEEKLGRGWGGGGGQHESVGEGWGGLIGNIYGLYYSVKSNACS